MKTLILITLTASVLVKFISSSEDDLQEPGKSCLEGEVYKKEDYRLVGDDEYVKMNTTLKCICSNISKEINETNYILNGFDLYYKLVYCKRSLNRTVSNCAIYQTCKRDLMYNYGVWRRGDQYVHGVDEMCICPQGLECRTAGFLPKSMISTYDNVLSYRCIEPIEEQLNYCAANEMYLVEIYRNLTMLSDDLEPVKLNTYKRCTCDTDVHAKIEEKREVDRSDETIFIKTFRCPWFYYNNVSLSCQDNRICRIGFMSEFGTEVPGVWDVTYYRTHCLCDLNRLCTHGEEIDDQYIYRCAVSNQRHCDELEMYKTEYYKNPYDKDSLMNTVIHCTCDRKYNDTRIYHYESIDYGGIKHLTCPRNTTGTLPSCDYREGQCRTEVWTFYGSENPGAMYRDYSEELCDCGARKCKLQNAATGLHMFNCVIESSRPVGHACGKNAVFKVEYYSKSILSSQQSSFIKKRTGFMCRCATHRSYDLHMSDFVIDPTVRNMWTKEYRCLNRPHTRVPSKTEPLKVCEHRELCQTNHFNDYGSEKPGQTYIDFVIPRCICNRYRKCGYVEKPDNITNIGYQYCVPKSTDYSRINNCTDGDIYKEELLIENKHDPKDLIKMDTRLQCKCNHDRNDKIKLDLIRFATEKETWIQEHRCVEPPEKELDPCFDIQICKRKFIYHYGKDRIGEEYVDFTEEYCECNNGSECIASAVLPKHASSPYDKVLSYRCIEKKVEKLRPCARNELFLKAIYRYISYSGSDSIKLNSYMKCTCEMHSYYVDELKPQQDPTDDEEIIRRYSCPWNDPPSVRESCKNFAICRKGYETDVGSEEPGKMMTFYYTTYCSCDGGRECLNVGRIGNETIHRCFYNRTTYLRISCRHNEIFRADVTRSNRTRLNTFELCRCLGEKFVWDDVRDPNFVYDSIRYMACNLPPDYKPLQMYEGLPYCEKEEVCMTHEYGSSGIERPQHFYEKTSLVNCKCTFPRICKEVLGAFSSTDKCLVVRGVKHRTYACSPNQEYLHVLYENKIRMNTIVKCQCEITIYDKYEERKNVTNYKEDVKRTLESYYCPRSKIETDERVKSCIDYGVCKKEIRGYYGKDIDSDLKYLHYRVLHCFCDGDRTCTNVGNESTPLPNSTVNIFRCLPATHSEKLYSCRTEQKFLISVFRDKPLPSTDREPMNRFLRCRCNFNARRSKQTYLFGADDDPTSPGETIFSSYCPAPEQFDVSVCRENEDCYVEEYEDYGRERPGEIWYNGYELCNCTGSRVCIRHRREGSEYIHRCERKNCRVGEICRILEYSVHKELIDNKTPCICEGTCSYHDQESIYSSMVYGNETHVFDCKHR